MRFPRMTIRRWMITVVVVAVAARCETLRHWWIHDRPFVELDRAIHAHEHAIEEQRYRGVDVPTCFGPSMSAYARNPRRAAHHARLKNKWQLAAARPWLPVEPDPPMPE
jgi:hypothetical protein